MPVLLATVRNPQLEELRKAQADYEEYRKAQSEYDELASKYTEKHPEVQAAKARVERLKQRIPPETLNPKSNDTGPANAARLLAPARRRNPIRSTRNWRRQLQEVKTEFEIREREKA